MGVSFRISLPATSANLGAAFDSAAVAFNLHLEIEAETAQEFSISATGRNADLCGVVENNLILETYKQVLREAGHPITPVALRMKNGIPLGMGCGSSAAGRLAAIAMANHFGNLGWGSERILAEGCALEGHPDNAAACWLGGLVVAAGTGRTVHAAYVAPPVDWLALVVLPADPLATSKARAVLPESYSRGDAVANIQSASLLGLAFAQSRADLLAAAMQDRIHQPYRMEMCPLLSFLLPLSGQAGILGTALSGAGPSVLAIVDRSEVERATSRIHEALAGGPDVEILRLELARSGARITDGNA